MAEQEIVSLKTFAEKHPDFSEASLRDIFFHSRERQSSRGTIPGNGFAPAFIRLSTSGQGRGKILIDVPRFFEILGKHRQAA